MKTRPAVLLLSLGVATVHLGLLWIYWNPEPKLLFGDEAIYLSAARSLLEARSGELDLLWPPLYPKFLAGILWASGERLVAVQLVQTLLLGLSALLFRDVARRWIGDGVAPSVVGWILIGYPPLVAFAHYLWPEILHLALVAIALWIVTFRRRSTPWMVIAGSALGLAMLSKSLLHGLLLLGIVLASMTLGRGRRRLEWRVALAVVAAGAVLLPTARANWQRHGIPAPAEPVIFNLWVGLNDQGRKSFVEGIVGREFQEYRATGPDARARRSILLRKIGRLIADEGVASILWQRLRVQYFRLLDRDSYLTDQLPGGDTLRGYRDTPPAVAAVVRSASYLSYGLLLTLGVGSMVLFHRPAAPWQRAALVFLAYNLVLFVALHVKSRYRIQCVPVLALFVALGAHRLTCRQAREVLHRFSPPRLGATLVAVLLTLLLSFGGAWMEGGPAAEAGEPPGEASRAAPPRRGAGHGREPA